MADEIFDRLCPLPNQIEYVADLPETGDLVRAVWDDANENHSDGRDNQVPARMRSLASTLHDDLYGSVPAFLDRYSRMYLGKLETVESSTLRRLKALCRNDQDAMNAIESFALHRYRKVIYISADGQFTCRTVTRLEYYNQLLVDGQLTEYLWHDYHHYDIEYSRDESIEEVMLNLRELASTAGYTDKQVFDFFHTNGMIVAQIDPSYEEWAKDGLLATKIVREPLPPFSWYLRGEQAIVEMLWEAFISSNSGSLEDFDRVSHDASRETNRDQPRHDARYPISQFDYCHYSRCGDDDVVSDVSSGVQLLLASILAAALQDHNDIQDKKLHKEESMFCHNRFAPNSFIKSRRFNLHGFRSGNYERYAGTLMYDVILAELEEIERLRRDQMIARYYSDEKIARGLERLSKKLFATAQAYNGGPASGLDINNIPVGIQVNSVHFDKKGKKACGKSMIRFGGQFAEYPARAAVLSPMFRQRQAKCVHVEGDYDEAKIFSIQATKEALSGANKGNAHSGLAGRQPSCTLVAEDYIFDNLKRAQFGQVRQRVGDMVTGATLNQTILKDTLAQVYEALQLPSPNYEPQDTTELVRLVSEQIDVLCDQLFPSLDAKFVPHPTFILGLLRQKKLASEGGLNDMLPHYKRAFEHHFYSKGSLATFRKKDKACNYASLVRSEWSTLKQSERQWLLDRGFHRRPCSAKWRRMFQQLCEFQSTYGHLDLHFVMNLAEGNEQRRLTLLYKWFGDQRYRSTFKERVPNQSNLASSPRPTEEQREKLERERLLLSIGFSFNIKSVDRFIWICKHLKLFIFVHKRHPRRGELVVHDEDIGAWYSDRRCNSAWMNHEQLFIQEAEAGLH